MQRSKLLVLAAFLLPSLVVLGDMMWPAKAIAGGGGAKSKICAEAVERYKELFPDAKEEPGVVVVPMYRYTFCPMQDKVPAGTTLRFVNVDKRTSHSVWFKDNGMAESERFFPEEHIDVKVDKLGPTRFLCGPHWEKEGMIGNITVE